MVKPPEKAGVYPQTKSYGVCFAANTVHSQAKSIISYMKAFCKPIGICLQIIYKSFFKFLHINDFSAKA